MLPHRLGPEHAMLRHNTLACVHAIVAVSMTQTALLHAAAQGSRCQHKSMQLRQVHCMHHMTSLTRAAGPLASSDVTHTSNLCMHLMRRTLILLGMCTRRYILMMGGLRNHTVRSEAPGYTLGPGLFSPRLNIPRFNRDAGSTHMLLQPRRMLHGS
jgi:hypothetical protein